MSRICVQNLPKYAAEDRLGEVFSQKGEITDVKLMRTKDGKSRQFGFIRFRTAEQAQEAIAYFNKSFLDTCRISCEIARKVGDPDIPRPWSRHSLKNKEKAAPNKDPSTVVVSKVEEKRTKKNVDDNDPKLKEFLQVMQPRAKTKLWANDTLVAAKENKGSTHEDTDGIVDKGERMLDEAAIDIECDKSDLKGGVGESSKQVARDEAVADMDYFRSRVRTEWSDSESDEDSDSHDRDEHNDHGSNKTSITINNVARQSNGDDVMLDRTERDVVTEDFDGDVFDPKNPSSSFQDEKGETLETGRLFVRNLPFSATEEELEELFSQYGKVVEVHIVVDKETR